MSSADDFLPHFIYAVLHANPANVHSNIEYIKRFCERTEDLSEAFYYLTMLESAVYFLENVTPEALNLDQALFDKCVAEGASGAVAAASLTHTGCCASRLMRGEITPEQRDLIPIPARPQKKSKDAPAAAEQPSDDGSGAVSETATAAAATTPTDSTTTATTTATAAAVPTRLVDDGVEESSEVPELGSSHPMPIPSLFESIRESACTNTSTDSSVSSVSSVEVAQQAASTAVPQAAPPALECHFSEVEHANLLAPHLVVRLLAEYKQLVDLVHSLAPHAIELKPLDYMSELDLPSVSEQEADEQHVPPLPSAPPPPLDGSGGGGEPVAVGTVFGSPPYAYSSSMPSTEVPNSAASSSSYYSPAGTRCSFSHALSSANLNPINGGRQFLPIHQVEQWRTRSLAMWRTTGRVASLQPTRSSTIRSSNSNSNSNPHQRTQLVASLRRQAVVSLSRTAWWYRQTTCRPPRSKRP